MKNATVVPPDALQGAAVTLAGLRRSYGLVRAVDGLDLLVLDEPTVGMDVGTRREFWRTMREFSDTGRTVLFATHYLDEAEEFADRAVLLRAGRIIADGSVAEVRAAVSERPPCPPRAPMSHSAVIGWTTR